MTENAGVEKKMEQSTEENVIEQRINDDQNVRNREDEEKDICADQQVTEPEISDEDRKMYEAYLFKKSFFMFYFMDKWSFSFVIYSL